MWKAAFFSSSAAGERVVVEIMHAQPVQELFIYVALQSKDHRYDPSPRKPFCFLLTPISAFIVEFMKCSVQTCLLCKNVAQQSHDYV